MPYYKAIIAYDGTDYHGWQIQPQRITIAGLLQTSYYAVFKKYIKIIGASRTDAGVHALGQVALFETDLNLTASTVYTVWNNILPGAVQVRSLTPVDASFHPQAHVVQKTYYYHLFQEKPLPFIARYGYTVPYLKNIDRLKRALHIFIGTHDFRSFCTGYEQVSTIRTIDSIDIIAIPRLRVWQIRVRGQSFLRYMIRRIVGAALDIACSNQRSEDELRLALAEKNPQQHFFTAPAKGLLLRAIRYAD